MKKNMINFKMFSLGLSVISLSACQLVSPIFVDYNGVRRDVATWINQQQLLSMQQKRSLVQLSKAQQQLYRLDQMDESQKFQVAKDNAAAMHCANKYLTANKIDQLQNVIFTDDKTEILSKYSNELPKIKLDEKSIICE